MRIHTLRHVALFLMALALLPFAAGCGSGEEREQAASGERDAGGKITLGVSPFQDTLLPLVAEKKGYFADEDLTVELKTSRRHRSQPAAERCTFQFPNPVHYWAPGVT